MMSFMYHSIAKHNVLPAITRLRNTFEDDDEITKGFFWVEPTSGGCVDQDRGSQCGKPRLHGTLYCKHHYALSHDSVQQL